MAGKIKGITIEINGDSTKLDKALKDVNAKGRDLNTQLKEINKSLKFNPGNAELIAQKQRVLAESIENTKKKLETLKTAQEQAKQAFERGEIGADAYEELQREVLKTENQLKSFTKELDVVNSKAAKVGSALQEIGSKGEKVGKTLQTHVTAPILAVGAASIAAFKDVDNGLDIIVQKTGATGEALSGMEKVFKDVFSTLPASSEEVGNAVGEINTQFGLVGKSLEDATVYMLKYSKITGQDITQATIQAKQAMEKYGLSAKDLPNVLDAVAKTAQDTGVNTDKLFDVVAKGSPQLKAMGLNFAEATAMMGRLEQKGHDSAKVVSLMTKAQANWAKDGKSMTQGLKELEQAVANATTEEEKLALVSEVFGTKGGSAMLEVLKSGALSAADFENAMGKAAGTVGTTFDAMQDPMDNWTVAFNKLKITLSEIGGTLQATLAPVIEQLSVWLDNMRQKWESLSPATQEFIVKAALIAAAVGPVIIVISKIVAAIGALVSFFSAGGAGAAAFAAAIGVITGPVGIVIGVIAALVAIGVALYKNWDTVKEYAIKIWTAISDFFSAFWNDVKNVFNAAINFIKSLINGAWDGIKNITSSVWNGIKSFVVGIWEGMKSAATGVFNGIKSFIVGIWEGLKSATTAAWNFIKNAMTSPIEAAKNFIANAIEKIKGFFNFKWQLPKIPLPHFKKIGTGFLGLPKIGVEWYDKGGIFKSPQIIGVGEKRPEFVGALDDLKSIVAEVIDKRSAQSGGDVTITGNTFIIREEADVEKIAEKLHQLMLRKQRGGLAT